MLSLEERKEVNFEPN